jgi:sec-independent protein translocase protein TatB
MFEIGFSEIVVIMVVALIVIGPERLPKVARTLGLLWGRAQRYVNGVRADIERDLHLEEMRQVKLKMEQDVMAAEQAANQAVQTLDHQVQSLAATAEPSHAEDRKPKSVPAPISSDKPKDTAPSVQQQFPID